MAIVSIVVISICNGLTLRFFILTDLMHMLFYYISVLVIRLVIFSIISSNLR